MKPIPAASAALLALACAGCMRNQTRAMAESCQQLLDHGERAGIGGFLEDAHAQLDRLARPRGRLAAYLQDLQDPDAMAYRAQLEQCVWQLENL
jgi:hypothetical protein